ncbi:MAG: glycosyltransferase [Candidatus Kapaibacterium sp.]|nr:glycosyltransferase [Bacteroidota bacterium]
MEVTNSTSSLVHPSLISIVIVNYNVKDFLLQCLQSIDRVRNNHRLEVIVVDNNSQDGSLEYLGLLFPWVTFIPLQENIGFGRANNVGIERANGEYILLLNPDTIVEEDTLLRMAEYMDAHTDVGICGCKVLNADGTFQAQCRRGFPTPWASFCKLFGLQALFPNSPLFAQYNQTFRNENETYNVDALIGAFMFCRGKQLKAIGGFDPDFFMYGEDLDLCYRMAQSGFVTAYVPTTTIIHFKGESTRRSSINEVKVFYQAMEIFAEKHYGTSAMFLSVLRLGIWLRSQLAYMHRYRRGIFLLLIDVLCTILMLLVATNIRFKSPFGFPPLAYPLVFIVLVVVTIGSMVSIGEYFEYKPTVRRAVFGYLVVFFVLSALTYYWNDYAFSRGVILMTIGLSIVCASVTRLTVALFDRLFGKRSDRRIAILGINEKTERMIDALRTGETFNAHILGVISTQGNPPETVRGIPVVGNSSYLNKLIHQYDIREVIIVDDTLQQNELINIVRSSAALGVRYHFAGDYENVVISRIITDISGTEATLPKYNILTFRNRITKRLLDIIGALFALLVGTPVVFLTRNKVAQYLQNWWLVLLGRKSIVGIFDDTTPNQEKQLGKIGLISLASISRPEQLSQDAIQKLNEYYVRNYSLSLDTDILLKFAFRKR